MPDRDNPKPPRRSPARAAPPRAAPPTPGGVPDLTARLEQLIAENAALKTKADHLEAQLRDAARELETLRPKVEELTARAARFEAEAAQTKQYQQERDEARRALDTLRAEQDRMIADAVRTALQAAETRHAAELAQIVRERDELKARLGATQPRLTEIPDSETTPKQLGHEPRDGARQAG